MATAKHNPLDLLGAHVRGQYFVTDGAYRLECSFDGIVESLVLNIHPDDRGAVLVAGEYHDISECSVFEVLLPSAMADRTIASVCSVRMF